MSLLVADASSLVELILGTPGAAAVEDGIVGRGADIHVPALCDVEVASVLRRLSRGSQPGRERVGAALVDYLDLSLTRHGHTLLLARVLQLGENLSAYDATYVALAERLECPLLTADRRLARAARRHTTLEVLP